MRNLSFCSFRVPSWIRHFVIAWMSAYFLHRASGEKLNFFVPDVYDC